MSFSFREGSVDSQVFEAIFRYDEYKLPDRFSQCDIVIDIGAHIGFFTYAAVQRGARNVYAFEADTENYNLAVNHMKDYIDQKSENLFLTRGAVWRSDISENVLYHSGYLRVDNDKVVNTGAGDVIWQKQGKIVPAIPFDTVVLRATEKAQKRIRLLKLDCEGSEWPILFTSNTLHLIDEICGEFHEIGGEYDDYSPPFLIEGFEHFTIHHLTKFLEERGFHMSYSRHIEADGTLSRVGSFFASRAKPNYEVCPVVEGHPLTAEASIPWLRTIDYLNSEDWSLLSIFAGYAGWMRSMDFSPDGSKVIIGSTDGTARLWETASGKVLTTLKGHTDGVVSVAFSPDSSKVITGSTDGTARLWEAASGKVLTTLKGHTNWVVSVAFSPDSSKVITGSTDGTARLWEAASGRRLVILESHTSWIVSIAFSPDSRKILTGSSGGTAQLWMTTTGQLLATLKGHTDTVTSVAFSPDGSKVITGSYDKTAKLWETVSSQELTTLEGHTDMVRSVAFSPDGSKILTGSIDGTARLWETASGQEFTILAGHTNWVVSAVFSPNGSRILTVSYDGSARLWETASGQLLATSNDALATSIHLEQKN